MIERVAVPPASALDSDPLLRDLIQRAVDEAARLLDAGGAFIDLIDPQTGRMRTEYIAGRLSPEDAAMVRAMSRSAPSSRRSPRHMPASTAMIPPWHGCSCPEPGGRRWSYCSRPTAARRWSPPFLPGRPGRPIWCRCSRRR